MYSIPVNSTNLSTKPHMICPNDPNINYLIKSQAIQANATINLVASENYASAAVRAPLSSLLSSKYAEGYPGKRYYPGCQIVDSIESTAIERCKELFGAEHANVQPHSGTQANMAALFALLKPGDTLLGMDLKSGGHLSHGTPISFSGTFYQSRTYGVDPETELLDYDAIEKLAHEYQPKLVIAGASAYSRTIDFARFAQIAKSVNALLVADIAHIAGLVATNLHPSPVPYADVVTFSTHKTLRGPRGGGILCTAAFQEKINRAVMPGIQGGPCINSIAAKAIAFGEAATPAFCTYQRHVLANAHTLACALQALGYKLVSGGTDNHLLIIDLRNKNITGLEAEKALESVGILANRNCIPADPQKPSITSGLRLGTPAITTRGMREHEMLTLAQLIHETLQNKENPAKLGVLASEVTKLAQSFPV